MYIASLVQAVQTTTDGVEDRSETLVYPPACKGRSAYGQPIGPMVSLKVFRDFRGTIGIHHLLKPTASFCRPFRRDALGRKGSFRASDLAQVRWQKIHYKGIFEKVVLAGYLHTGVLLLGAFLIAVAWSEQMAFVVNPTPQRPHKSRYVA